MAHRNLYAAGLELSFCVWENMQCKGTLRIVPLGCEIGETRTELDESVYHAYGMYVQVKLEQECFACTVHDFLDLRGFHDLQKFLNLEPEQRAGAVTIGGECVVLEYAWQEDGDLAVSGGLPPAMLPEQRAYWLSLDPQARHRCIWTTVQFEFRMAPERTLEPLQELDALLQEIQRLEEEQNK